jgi:hypothetical protein
MNWLQHLRITAVNRQQWMGGALLALFLSVLALTLSETLHHEMHVDSGEAEHHQEHDYHHCAVTMLQSGQVDVLVISVTPIVNVGATLLPICLENNFVRSVDLFLPPSCGPPALLS